MKGRRAFQRDEQYRLLVRRLCCDISLTVLCLSLVFYKERFGRAVEEEGEFARIRVCKQETLDMEEEYPSWAAPAPSYLSRS